jgi:hypothetical protein
MQSTPENRVNNLRNTLTQSLQNGLHRRNRVDTFRFNLPSVSSFRASLNGISKKANVDLELLNSKGAVVAASRRRGRNPEALAVEKLDAGSYRLKAVLKQGQKTQYKLNFNSKPRPGIVLDQGPIVNPQPNNPTSPSNPGPSNPGVIGPDLGGNSSSTATNKGKIGSAVSRISDALGNGDNADWYAFTVGEDGFPSSRLNMTLTGNAGVFAHVYSTADPSTSLGNVAAYNGNNLFGNSKLALSAGTYLLKVSPVGGNTVSYNLDLSATGIADSAGNTKDAARVINNLQPLNTSGQPVSFTDFVGHGDIFDNYTFKTDKKATLTIQFDRLSNNNPTRTRIQHQLDKIDGLPPANLYWKNAQGASLSNGFDALTSSSYTLTGELEPGTYNLQLKSYFSDGDNEYRVTFSTTA